MNLYNENNVDYIYDQMHSDRAFGSCEIVSEESKRQVIDSTLFHYDQGLRGHRLRHKVRTDCGVSILLIIQFIFLIIQIIEWIKKLRD